MSRYFIPPTSGGMSAIGAAIAGGIQQGTQRQDQRRREETEEERYRKQVEMQQAAQEQAQANFDRQWDEQSRQTGIREAMGGIRRVGAGDKVAAPAAAFTPTPWSAPTATMTAAAQQFGTPDQQVQNLGSIAAAYQDGPEQLRSGLTELGNGMVYDPGTNVVRQETLQDQERLRQERLRETLWAQASQERMAAAGAGAFSGTFDPSRYSDMSPEFLQATERSYGNAQSISRAVQAQQAQDAALKRAQIDASRARADGTASRHSLQNRLRAQEWITNAYGIPDPYGINPPTLPFHPEDVPVIEQLLLEGGDPRQLEYAVREAKRRFSETGSGAATPAPSSSGAIERTAPRADGGTNRNTFSGSRDIDLTPATSAPAQARPAATAPAPRVAPATQAVSNLADARKSLDVLDRNKERMNERAYNNRRSQLQADIRRYESIITNAR
jgi:hypothetical protein